jgi:hypothetical protein
MVFKFYPTGEVEIFEKDILLGKGIIKDDKVCSGYNVVIVENILEDFCLNVAKAILPKKKVDNENADNLS